VPDYRGIEFSRVSPIKKSKGILNRRSYETNSRSIGLSRLFLICQFSSVKAMAVFKEKTGSAILEYLTLLRIEYASTMLNNPEYTIEYITSQYGFKTARQLQRILKK
jgi:transcriptional regulator GlxA family with amidase domain